MRTALVLATLVIAAQINDNNNGLREFPPVSKGMTRFFASLPKLDDEANHRVQLIIGKTILVDQVNRFSLSGVVGIAGTIPGVKWYHVDKLDEVESTAIAPPLGQPNELRFVTLGGRPFLIEYDSKSPVVVYVPAGAEVHYRIWRVAPDTVKMRQG